MIGKTHLSSLTKDVPGGVGTSVLSILFNYFRPDAVHNKIDVKIFDFVNSLENESKLHA